MSAGVQDMWRSFLYQRGVNAQLAVIIRAYLEDKELREYVVWLKRMENFNNPRKV